MEFLQFFTKWASLVSWIFGFLGALLIIFSYKLIPSGLRLPKEMRHPYKKKVSVNNAVKQSATNIQEWWGQKFRSVGLALFFTAFLIQIWVKLPI